MSENCCCGSTPACEACALEVFEAPAPDFGDASSQYVLFDDQALTQNQVTDSPPIPVSGANRAFITGVYINRSAAATISFEVFVSENGETWTSVGSFNIPSLGYFSTNSFSLNAMYVKCRSTHSAAATAIFGAVVSLSFV